jgi:Family of unknown function (DUF6326)
MRQYQDIRVDVKLVLSALWVATMFLFAYVDLFGLYRAEALEALLDGRLANAPFAVDQTFLILTLAFIVPPSLMVALSLLLKPRVNRIVNIVVSILYAVIAIASCIGETWAYYIIGMIIEAALLVVIARVAWKWPAPEPR